MSTLTDLIAEYLDTFDRETQKQTIKTYRFGLKQFVEIVGENAELNEATYIQFLNKTKRSMKPGTQAVCRSSIAGLYGFAAFKKIIPPLSLKSATHYHGRKQGRRDKIDPDMDTIRQVLTYANTLTGDLIALRDRAFVLTLADTGLRIFEACELTRGQINWSEGRAMVIGKGDKQAVVRFSERSLKALQDYLRARAELDGKQGKPLNSLPLFARHDMSAKNTVMPMTTKGMWRSIRTRINESGVDEPEAIRIHDFRHYFVSTIVKATGNIKLAQVLARHERIETTNRYAHLGGEEDKAYHEIFNK
jgi:integrase/recombinase XerC